MHERKPSRAEAIADRIFRLIDRRREPTLFSDKKPFYTRNLAPRIEELLALAVAAPANSQEDIRRLYHEAGNEAIAIYSTIETIGITTEERVIRGRYAEVAVTSFINAGELEDAVRFGEIALNDRILPEVSKDRIQKALEIGA